MRSYSLTHLGDESLRQGLCSVVARDRATTADMLAYLGEFDERQLYRPAGYPSMFAYCAGELHFSEDTACKRIRAARAAREFPVLFHAVAEGCLSLSAVVILAPHLTAENVDELLLAGTHMTNAKMEELLAERFPRPDMPTLVRALPTPQVPTGTVAAPPTPTMELSAARRIESAERPAKVTPLAPRRFGLQLTMSEEMRDDLRYAQELLSHKIPSGDITAIIHHAIKMTIAHEEQEKFAATSRPGKERPSDDPRHIQAHVKRTVWKRDEGRCTFVSEAGYRCSARRFLEFDHVDPVARGGQATIENIRLRCRAHNQYGAEQAFGADFMRHKKQQARRGARSQLTSGTSP